MTAPDRTPRRLTTPHSAALAGVLFALLFGTSLVLIRLALPDGAERGAQWATGSTGMIRTATILMPFAGITFLWFIGVIRDNLGALEDRFFASVFLGSGLLFLAMTFAAAAAGAGLSYARHVLGAQYSEEMGAFGQGLVTTLGNTYALRMAAVFMVSLATIWLKTRLMPTWLTVVSYLAAVALLVACDLSLWLTVVFPLWVLVVSLVLLTGHHRTAKDPSP